jgi:hypothetical protein
MPTLPLFFTTNPAPVDVATRNKSFAVVAAGETSKM